MYILVIMTINICHCNYGMKFEIDKQTISSIFLWYLFIKFNQVFFFNLFSYRILQTQSVIPLSVFDLENFITVIKYVIMSLTKSAY